PSTSAATRRSPTPIPTARPAGRPGGPAAAITSSAPPSAPAWGGAVRGGARTRGGRPPPPDRAEPLEHSQNLRNTIDYAPLLRACLVNLDRWVTAGVEPPASRHPQLADRTAVPFEALHVVFDKIPGAHYPRHHARPCRLDFSTLPPRPGPACGSLVS